MITKKQKEILDFLNTYSKKEGYLEKISNQPRSINIYSDKVIKTIIPKKIESFSVPILGSANAGPATIFAEGNISGYLRISRNDLNRKNGVFALRVDGDSMNKA